MTGQRPPLCRHVGAAVRSVDAVACDLQLAEACCLRAGERWTEPRRRTYELLAEAGRPVKAYDLVAAFGPGRRPAKPATVYRALDFLESLGLVHRVTSLGAFIVCRHSAPAHQGVFLICDCCRRTDELGMDADQYAAGLALPHGFLIEKLILELRGLCPACRVQ